MTIDALWTYIKKSENLLKSLEIKFEFEDIQYGSIHENYSEIGEQCILNIHGNEYCVGTATITEDGEDWAQAEAYQTAWCQDGTHKHINPQIVFDLIQNYKSDSRNLKIESIIE